MKFKENDWVIGVKGSSVFLGQAMSSYRIDADGSKVIPDKVIAVSDSYEPLKKAFKDVDDTWVSYQKEVKKHLDKIEEIKKDQMKFSIGMADVFLKENND